MKQMEQQQIAIILQLRADNHKYNCSGELAADCSELGASYKVFNWIDRYCLSRDLYRETDYS